MDRRHFCGWMLGTSVATWLGGQASAAPPAVPAKLKWLTDLKAAQKVAETDSKLLLVVFGASWCTFCHKLERETLTDKKIISLVEREFVPVHLDFDRDSKLAKKLEVEQLPASLVLTPKADLLLHVVGYLDARKYEKNLQSALQKRTELVQVPPTTVTR